jgi:hypothetical protein
MRQEQANIVAIPVKSGASAPRKVPVKMRAFALVGIFSCPYSVQDWAEVADVQI